MAATCRSCGAEIVWAITENGRRIPLDAEPVMTLALDAGLFLLKPPAADTSESTAITIPREKGAMVARRSHFATCPNAGQHRRSR